ncbi:MAG: DUF2070 family protein [Candidatus Symbiothrix sp.]|jgi:hypothetical protein|nr:DUF2070 family protein [Candidatus Symbiothrix sp.]
MFKKIQQYLLLHYPLLWNIKIAPVFAVLAVLHIALFAIGYFSTQFENLTTYGRYNEVFTYPLVFMFCLIIILLVLILWLIHYSQNNAFRVFYPQSSASLYGEWLMVLLIVFALFALPFTHIKGVEAKIRTFVADKEEVARNVEIINQIECLIPDYKNKFLSSAVRNDYFPDSILKKNPNEQAFASLLNQYFESGPIYNNLPATGNQQTVELWLLTEDEPQIRSLIRNFLLLVEKHHLRTSLTVDKWMELIYNPPTYPITDDNLIAAYKNDNNPNYVPFEKLNYAYKDIYRTYYDTGTADALLLILCLAGIASLLIFSCRYTDRKSWLIALIAALVLSIVYSAFSALVDMLSDTDLFMLPFWFGVFVFELIYVIRLICRSLSKRYSSVMINHLFWMLPFVPIMLVAFYLYVDGNYYTTTLRKWIDDNFMEIIWISVVFAFVTVGLFIHYIVRPWKSLPEQ